jgi:hypothetical protein
LKDHSVRYEECGEIRYQIIGIMVSDVGTIWH